MEWLFNLAGVMALVFLIILIVLKRILYANVKSKAGAGLRFTLLGFHSDEEIYSTTTTIKQVYMRRSNGITIAIYVCMVIAIPYILKISTQLVNSSLAD